MSFVQNLPDIKTSLQFEYLPLFAQHLLKNSLQEYAEKLVRFLHETEINFLKPYKELPYEKLLEATLQTSKRFLTYLAENNAQAQIEESNKRWTEDELQPIKREAVVVEDIRLFGHLRKKLFVHFVPSYSNDVGTILSLINEIDLFLLHSETKATQTYINLLGNRIEEQAYLNAKITDTAPGIIYLFNLITKSISFINKRGEEFLGVGQSELIQNGEQALKEFVHPNDLEHTFQAFKNIQTTLDADIRDFEQRLKNKRGEYVWMRNYISVFKRNEQGQPVEVIGNILDIDTEKQTAEQLQQKEEQLSEAQAVGQMGSFEWNFTTKKGIFSDQFLRMFEIPDTPSFDIFLTGIHPDDREKVKKTYWEALDKTGLYETEFRYIKRGAEKTISSKAKISREGDSVIIKGIVMDVTSRAAMVNQLRESRELYKQAQALSHIGHYTLDVKTRQITLTEELRRIYGFEGNQPHFSYEDLVRLRHPDDSLMVQGKIQQAIANLEAFDFYYRILLPNGVCKTLQGIGRARYNENGEPVQLVGTVQDVTIYQNLVQKLQQNQWLYKQAEVLANMGNWSWNMHTEKLEWSDQLYQIYGLEPQSEAITTERFLSFVDPEDRPRIEESIQAEYPEDVLDYTFKIIDAHGVQKTIRSIAHAQRSAEGKLISIIGSEQDITEHQNLVQQLKESEFFYKQAQSLAHVGNWSWNIPTNLLFWSDEMYRIFGLQPQSELITFETYLQFIHPDDRDWVANKIQNSMQSDEPWSFQHRIVWRNGEQRYLFCAGETAKNQQGQIDKMLGSAQDITQQKEAEKRLSDQQNFIQKVADATPSIIAAYNIHSGQYVFINQGIYKLLGYSREEALQNGIYFFMELIHPDDRTSIVNKNIEAIAEFNKPEYQASNHMIVDFEYRLKHKDGNWRWFHTYGTIFDRNNQGHIEHILNISLDITQRVEVEKRLAEQEHFIKQIADASPTILYLYDVPQNGIAYINREIFFVLGYSPEEIIEWEASVTERLYHPDDLLLLPERKGSGKHFQEQDSMMQYECRMRHKGGDWCWLLVREVPFKVDEQGNVLQVLGAALDINRRKEMERSLVSNSFLLQQSNASLEEFAYVASHDLKEPLRKISTFGDRLVATQSTQLTEDGKVYLKKIVDASQRMQTMISDLLSISMITGNKSFEPYSLQTVLEEALQTLEYKIEQKNALVQADPLPVANIVLSQFRQLFQNLLSNSLKFTREDVQPLIQIKYRQIKEEDIKEHQLKKAAAYHQIDFMDNGIGFENEYAGKIFAIFQRLHGRSEYEGTGIGLAICKKIVEHHNGIIYATGIPDQGATFTIILPA